MDIKLSKIAIIAENPELADRICRRFRAFGTYLVLLEAPSAGLEEYGVFRSDCVKIGNALRAHRPEAVLLVGCQTKVLNEIRHHLPPVHVLELASFDEAKLASLPGFRRRDLEPRQIQPGHAVPPSAPAASTIVHGRLVEAFEAHERMRQETDSKRNEVEAIQEFLRGELESLAHRRSAF